MEVMPDHVHLFIVFNLTLKINAIVKNLKGYSSYYMRKTFIYLWKYPSLWTRSCFIESVGHISEKTVVKYIENQFNKPFYPPVKTGTIPGLIS